ncbi:MAG TPA: hypothetical protein DCL21_03255 [Alphaproteobacteria bacterium]|nr:hypothetical protein [Alphaproteobacteria bacterium]
MSVKYSELLNSYILKAGEVDHINDLERIVKDINGIIDYVNLDENSQNTVNSITKKTLEYFISCQVEKLDKVEGYSLVNLANHLETFMNEHPEVGKINEKSIKDEIIPKLVDLIEQKYIAPTIRDTYGLCLVDTTGDSSSKNSFLKVSEIFVNCNLYKSYGKIGKLKYFNQHLSSNFNEVLLSFALLKSLNSINITIGQDYYHHEYHHQDLFKILERDYFGILNRIDFFKAKGYRAICVKLIQTAQNSEFDSNDFNMLCLKVISLAIAECPELSLETFGLNSKDLDELYCGKNYAQRAFLYAEKLDIFGPKILNNKELLLPNIESDEFKEYSYIFKDMKDESVLSEKFNKALAKA